MENIQKLGIITSFFNLGGYVFDFSTSDFDNFTATSIGIPLCDEYKMSKGKSLESYIKDAEITELNKIKLLTDLFEYYELNLMDNDKDNNPEHFKKYEQTKELLNTLISNREVINSKINIDSKYIQEQITFINENIDKNPTQVIGVSKELIESICKTILKMKNIEYSKNDDMTNLLKKTFDSIELVKFAQSDEQDSIDKSLKKIKGGFCSLIMGISEIRNEYGSGHGKTSDFLALDVKYAKLIADSSITISSFLSNYI